MEIIQQIVALLPPDVIAFLAGPMMIFIYGLGFAILEFIIGKTDLIKSNSTLELILVWVGKIFKVLQSLSGMKTAHTKDKVPRV